MYVSKQSTDIKQRRPRKGGRTRPSAQQPCRIARRST